MASNRCFEQGCEHEVQYLCPCTSPETLSCEFHLEKHRNHSFDSIFLEPYLETQDAILGFLVKEKLKKEKLKKKILDSQNLKGSENSFEKRFIKLNSDSAEIDSWIQKISQAQKISKLDQDPILKLLALQPEEAVKNIKEMIPENPYANKEFVLMLNEEIERMVENSLNKRLSSFKNRFEENEKTFDLKLAEINRSIIQKIDENKRNFEYLKQEINIERRLEEHEKSEKNPPKNEELETKIEKRFADQAKLIDSKLAKMADEFEENIMKLKNLNQEIQLETQNQINMLNSQFTSTFNDLSKKINENLLFTPQALAKKRAILNRGNKKTAERSFRETCSWYEKECPDSSQPLSQDFQEYIHFYHQISSFYLTKEDNNRTKLIIYDTESERKEEKIIESPELLNYHTSITQLPNGELFCYGTYPVSGITLIIDKSYKVRNLPSGIPCRLSSGIGLNDNVFCFGGIDKNETELALVSKFDLNENRWINDLSPMPQPDWLCSCVIFNANILVSGKNNRNILRYSVDKDTFSTIPYQFAPNKRKFLINVERLYLIECKGFIYESEAWDDCSWKQISKSGMSDSYPLQVYCAYNKGGIYIATQHNDGYYKFDLSQNIMTKLII